MIPLFSPRVATDRWTSGPTRQHYANPLPSDLGHRLAGLARPLVRARALACPVPLTSRPGPAVAPPVGTSALASRR